MGIQINGVTDSISAVDGSLSLTGAELASVGGINVSGVVTATTYIVGSGSTSAPSISPSGDSNTGIFFPSADTIAFGEGGAEVARFDSNGRLGIGTNTINAKLEISGNSGGRGIRLSEPSGEELDISAGAAANDPARIATSSGSGIAFAVNGTSGENARIDTSGRFGIGTTAPIAQTHIMLSDVTGYTSPSNDGFVLERGGGNDVAISIATDNTRNGYLIFADGDSANPAWVGYDHSANAMSFRVNASERARIDSSGRLLVGTSTATNNLRLDAKLAVVSTGSGNFGGVNLTNYGGTGAGTASFIDFNRSRGTTDGSFTSVAASDALGYIVFRGATGSAFDVFAQIAAEVDGTPGASDAPGRLVFSTTADGASSSTSRFIINSAGAHYPATDNSFLLGTASFRWSAVYAVNGTIQTSDAREKTEVTDAVLGSDFIKSLRPVSYKWLVGHNDVESTDDGEVRTPKPGVRTHWGFIAQEVKQAVDVAGVDFGGWVLTDKDDSDSQQGLRYDQFIAPLTKALQEALAEIDVLKAKVAALESA